jgi:filamentous hemagglutinin family protein
MKNHKLFLILLMIFSLEVYAQITTDGFLGPSSHLQGPDYQITSDLGQQFGSNLFHSFQTFNLNSQENATFSGPNTVQNVISRVTGGNPSHIDGLIRSTIQNANLYFLNPYGLFFGSNARLDISGSFHASTADYLSFSDGGLFHARQPEKSLLTIAPIEAFGFLTNTPAPITIEESQLIVFKNKTLSLIGGDLTINANTAPFFDKDNGLDSSHSILFAESGRINLISQAALGEVILTDLGISVSQNSQGGQITVHNSGLGVSGFRGGDIFIRAGQMKLVNSFLESVTLGDENGGLIDITVDHLELIGNQQLAGIYTGTLGSGNSGPIHVSTKQLNINGTAGIFTITQGIGDSGNLHIQATESLNIKGQYISEIEVSNGIFSISSKEANGNAGNIDVETGQLTINEGLILTITEQSGNAGNIHLKVADEMKVIGTFVPEINAPSGILNATAGDGDAGNIQIEARKMNLTQGGQILNRTIGSGNSGLIDVSVTEEIIASGADEDGNNSGFMGQSGDEDVNNTGHAAQIRIKAHQITFLEGATIESDTFGAGKGGTILIQVADTLTLAGQEGYEGTSSNISASSLSLEDNAGDAGRIKIEAGQFHLRDGGAIYNVTLGPGKSGAIRVNVDDTLTISGGFEIPWQEADLERFRFLPSGIFATSGGLGAKTGDSGKIAVRANQIILKAGGQINNDTYGGGNGGFINVFVTGTLKAEGKHARGNFFYFSGMRSGSLNSKSYAGKAGNLFIEANRILLTEPAEFSTEAVNAEGGNITLVTPNLLFLQDAKITTSVQGGTSDGGNITVNNPIFIIIDKGQIIAQAYEGHGGNIQLKSDHFYASVNSVISASSKLGLDGEIDIDSPDTNVNDGVLLLPSSPMVDASILLKQTCENMSFEEYMNRSSFIFFPIAGSSLSPFDLQPSRLSANSFAQTVKKNNTHSDSMNHQKSKDARHKDTKHRVSTILAFCQPKIPEKMVMPEQLF